FCCVYTLYTLLFIFSFTPTATSVFYTLSLHDALPILFNPWGVFLRRWQLDDVRIDSGEVEIQTYTPKPEPSPAKPWFHIFLPQRVYLKHVETNPADVTWRFRGEKGGFFGTDLLITPHGLDFNYQASGGTLKMALIPNLRLRDTHLLITRKLLTLYNLDLQQGDDPAGPIHAEGKAGKIGRASCRERVESIEVSDLARETRD